MFVFFTVSYTNDINPIIMGVQIILSNPCTCIQKYVSGQILRHTHIHKLTISTHLNGLRLTLPLRLFTQMQKRLKISEEHVRRDILPQAEADDPADDPYDFKEGDIEYSFPATKKLKGLSQDPSRKSKV